MHVYWQDHQYVRWHVLIAGLLLWDPPPCPLCSFLSPSLPLSLSALSLFQLCVLAAALPCITKPVLPACPIVLRTSQVMINTNTQQWELQHPASVGVACLKVGTNRQWPALRSHKPRILYDFSFLVEGLERWKSPSPRCSPACVLMHFCCGKLCLLRDLKILISET